jgi:hypothetical protein
MLDSTDLKLYNKREGINCIDVKKNPKLLSLYGFELSFQIKKRLKFTRQVGRRDLCFNCNICVIETAALSSDQSSSYFVLFPFYGQLYTTLIFSLDVIFQHLSPTFQSNFSSLVCAYMA